VLLAGFRARRADATPALGVPAVAASLLPGPEAIIVVVEPLPTAPVAQPSPCAPEAAAAPPAEPRAAQVTRIQPRPIQQQATADTSLALKPNVAPLPPRPGREIPSSTSRKIERASAHVAHLPAMARNRPPRCHRARPQ
jgi:hypothetical protein